MLIPDEFVDRSVRRGLLGCPVCHREYHIVDGVVNFGGEIALSPRRSAASEPVGAEAISAFLGLGGPGGYVLLVGEASMDADSLAALLPGIHLVALNPPGRTIDASNLSVLRSDRVPIKSRSMRGVVLGADVAADPSWQAAAAGMVLPGLRVVGNGPEPVIPELDLLASAGGWWVGRRK
ncbi:MAG: hypothetical protein ABJD11_17425 [Gemmatimonadota bacterium]